MTLYSLKPLLHRTKKRKKNHITYKENPTNETANFSMESLKHRGVWAKQEPERWIEL